MADFTPTEKKLLQRILDEEEGYLIEDRSNGDEVMALAAAIADDAIDYQAQVEYCRVTNDLVTLRVLIHKLKTVGAMW